MTSRPLANVFAATRIDRLAERRKDADWVRSALESTHTRFVPVWRRRNLLSDTGAAVLLDRQALADTEPTLDNAILIGGIDGTACFAVDIDAGKEPPQFGDASFRTLRSVGAEASDTDAALLAHAQAISFWRRSHRYCGRCGSANAARDAGHVLVCTDTDCGHTQFPRCDPAIIVLVSHGGRALLGRQHNWPPGMYSTIAGFVEPGESLEHAVAREVAEETGVQVGSVNYHSSQPWPFPSSLMLGFHAVATTTGIERGDDELEEARWFSREDIVNGMQTGEFRVPSTISIAYRLVEQWFDTGDAGRLAEHIDAAVQT